MDSFLQLYDEYNWKMSVLVHFTLGMQARANEVVTNMIRSSNGALRTVHYAEKMV